jgi:hypothetical protein
MKPSRTSSVSVRPLLGHCSDRTPRASGQSARCPAAASLLQVGQVKTGIALGKTGVRSVVRHGSVPPRTVGSLERSAAAVRQTLPKRCWPRVFASPLRTATPLHGAAVCYSVLDKGEKVGIDDIPVSRQHAVRKAIVNLDRAVLQQFDLKQRCILVWHDLVVGALHDEGGYGHRL